MVSITFDPLNFTRKLREAGFDERQAEAVVRVVADAQDKLVGTEHFDAKMLNIDSKFDKLTWMLGACIALNIAIFTRIFF